jgi:hypothetical protein
MTWGQGQIRARDGRRLTIPEMMRLQGVDAARFELGGTSKGLLGEMLGNTMSINVLSRLFPRALEAAQLIPLGLVEDTWETGAAFETLCATGGGLAAVAAGPPPPAKRARVAAGGA